VANAFEEWFWEQVEKRDDGRWEWKGWKDKAGYGVVTVMAHRLAYMLTTGAIGKGLALDHLCRERDCVNPAHLDPVPNTVNIMRGVGFGAKNAAKTACHKGHPFDEANTGFWKNGGRYCRICKRASSRAFARRKENWQGHEGPGYNSAKTECKRGHVFDAANTYTWRGSRQCRTCARERAQVKAAQLKHP